MKDIRSIVPREPRSDPKPRLTAAVGVRRGAELAAIFMIGDGVLGLIQPRRHIALWQSDVAALDSLTRRFADRPGRRRLYGVLQIAAGLALAAHQHGTATDVNG